MGRKGQAEGHRVATSYVLLLVQCVAVCEAIDRHSISIFKANSKR